MVGLWLDWYLEVVLFRMETQSRQMGNAPDHCPSQFWSLFCYMAMVGLYWTILIVRRYLHHYVSAIDQSVLIHFITLLLNWPRSTFNTMSLWISLYLYLSNWSCLTVCMTNWCLTVWGISFPVPGLLTLKFWNSTHIWHTRESVSISTSNQPWSAFMSDAFDLYRL